MADEVREVVREPRNRGSSLVAKLALILAVLALIVAVVAYNRSGEDIENQVGNDVNNAIDEAQGQR